MALPPGTAIMDGQLPDIYARAQAARDQARMLAAQLHDTQRRTRENWQLIQAAWEHAAQMQAQRLTDHTEPDRLRRSAYARLQARLASMPVIEQAKGIIMAKYGWSEDQAFDVLRRASQRENVKVRDLAARIVAGTALPAPGQPASASGGPRPGGQSPRLSSAGSRHHPRASA
jgi:hypothetical protein